MKKLFVFALIVVFAATIASIDADARGRRGGKHTYAVPFSATTATPDLDVIAIQKKLIICGYECGNADGIYGPATVEAVRSFQADNGLEVDGVVGPATQQALGL